jgi:hypothetical protein
VKRVTSVQNRGHPFFIDLTSAFFQDDQLNKNNLAFVKIDKKI